MQPAAVAVLEIEGFVGAVENPVGGAKMRVLPVSQQVSLPIPQREPLSGGEQGLVPAPEPLSGGEQGLGPTPELLSGSEQGLGLATAPLEAVTLPNGMHLLCGSPTESRFIYNEVFVQRCYSRHGIRVRAGDTVVDVGANVGLFTLFLLRGGAIGCVH